MDGLDGDILLIQSRLDRTTGESGQQAESGPKRRHKPANGQKLRQKHALTHEQLQ